MRRDENAHIGMFDRSTLQPPSLAKEGRSGSALTTETGTTGVAFRQTHARKKLLGARSPFTQIPASTETAAHETHDLARNRCVIPKLSNRRQSLLHIVSVEVVPPFIHRMLEQTLAHIGIGRARNARPTVTALVDKRLDATTRRRILRSYVSERRDRQVGAKRHSSAEVIYVPT